MLVNLYNCTLRLKEKPYVYRSVDGMNSGTPVIVISTADILPGTLQ